MTRYFEQPSPSRTATINPLHAMNCTELPHALPLDPGNLQFALDQVEDGLVIVESGPLRQPGPRIRFANVKACEMTGFSPEDLFGAPIERIFDGDWLEDLLRKLPLVAEKKRTFQTEKRLLCADGSARRCRWLVSSQVGEDGRPRSYTLLLREMRSLPGVDPGGPGVERGLPGSIDVMLERSRNESLALLSVGVAHDFNNVLTTIGTHLSMARMSSGIAEPVRREIESAEKAVDGGQALAQQLLGFARGNAPKRCKGNLGELLRHAEQLAMIGAKVRCDLSVSTSLWSCPVEETQILQVFHNLLVNARQAMPEGGVVQVNCENVRMEEESALSLPPGPYVVTSVRDHGCGIPEERLERIFDPYFTTKTDGTGIGLATCQLAVQRHDGLITVRSREGVGTEFRVYLPATGEPVEASRRPETETAPPAACRDGGILVVDDHAEVLYVNRVRSGQPFSAVLMDMTLPGGMSGEETFREIRSLDPEALAIATSGHFENGEDEMHSRGYAGILAKPYDAEKLSEALGNLGLPA